MNAPSPSPSPIPFEASIPERPFPYPAADWPYTLFFNGERMPRYSQLWDPMMEPLDELIRDCDSDDPIRLDLRQVVWGFESLGKIVSCAPAVFVYAVQELLLFALDKPDQLVGSLRSNPNLAPLTNEILPALLEGGFQMRASALDRKQAYWTVGYEQWDLPELERELGVAWNLPADITLPPHQRDRLFWVRFHLERQVTKFHRLAQSGRFPKEMRHRLHSITVPDEAFLRLLF